MIKTDLLKKLFDIGFKVTEVEGFELVDVEFVKEAGNWYLRYYIDRPGGITLDDCQLISAKVGQLLDAADPIPYSYILEVSSPGVERHLKKDEDFLSYTGSYIEIKTIEEIEAKKVFIGTLCDYSNNIVTINNGKNYLIPRQNIVSKTKIYMGRGVKMNIEFVEALAQIEKEKGISKEILLDAIEASLISAYKKNYGSSQNVSVNIDRDTGEVKVFSKKTVTDEAKDALLEIDLVKAHSFNPIAKIGDIITIEVTPKKFGRIAAQTAKQVVMQRIREAERDLIFEEYSGRETDIVTGIVQRFDKKNVIIDLGRTEVILPLNEQIPSEPYIQGSRIKVYILEVKKTTKGPQITVSRSHPGLVKRLFELEVPEIYEGLVEIKGISRESGSRTKIAVYSKNENIDPVGASVGYKGSRVQSIVDELHGEKIDIIKWDKDAAGFISNALSPAKVLNVAIEENTRIARVTVLENQLSLAIGKEGQNARLAARLTGWKIDIKSQDDSNDNNGLEGDESET